jgi:UDP-N-acetylmuramate dehydrogenase
MSTILENVPLAPFTSLKIGGPARFFAPATTLAELREALQFARQKGVPFGILGGGTNLLVSDYGFEGVVIRLQMEGIRVSGCEIEAEAGVDLTGLVQRTAEWGLSGMESLAGIPGLVGGAIRGNAGAYGSSIGEVTTTVFALNSESLELVALDREQCGFSYRSSRFKRDPRFIVVSALLTLTAGDAGAIRHKVETTIAKRTAKGLQCEKSVGSFFMNPVVTDQELVQRFEADQKLRCRESRIPAGWLIDQAGLRNTRVGAAMVSARHANYLINTGTASAQEMVGLARLVKSKVRDAMGVQLQEEVSCLGFPPAESAQQ